MLERIKRMLNVIIGRELKEVTTRNIQAHEELHLVIEVSKRTASKLLLDVKRIDAMFRGTENVE